MVLLQDDDDHEESEEVHPCCASRFSRGYASAGQNAKLAETSRNTSKPNVAARSASSGPAIALLAPASRPRAPASSAAVASRAFLPRVVILSEGLWKERFG